MTEETVAGAVKKKLLEHFPADIWQVCMDKASLYLSPPLPCRPLSSSTQVFVGRNFGCFVTHEDGKFMYFYIGQTGFCIFAV
jgi:hypothetical protein